MGKVYVIYFSINYPMIEKLVQYLERKRTWLWAGYSEELDEGVGLIKISRRVVRGREWVQS